MFLVYNWSILSILFGARLFAITVNGYAYEKLLIARIFTIKLR